MPSMYTIISKKLGWQPRLVRIPEEKEIDALIEDASEGNAHAFERLFEIQRFARGDASNIDRINKVSQAYMQLADKFREM